MDKIEEKLEEMQKGERSEPSKPKRKRRIVPKKESVKYEYRTFTETITDGDLKTEHKIELYVRKIQK